MKFALAGTLLLVHNGEINGEDGCGDDAREDGICLTLLY